MGFSTGQIKQIANEIWESGAKKVDLLEFCESKLRELNPKITDLEITDEIDEFLSRVRRQIEKYITSFHEKGIPPNLKFDDCLPNTICRYSSEAKTNGWIRNHRTRIRRAIKAMDWITFEHFCRHILEINGITKSFVTRASKEGGVDFYGLLEMCNYTEEVFLSSVKLRILGQAKRYSGNKKVNEGGIDEIRTKYSDFQSGRGRAVDILPNWFTMSNFPVIRMVVTTTGFTRGAKESAARDYIIRRDGDQIAEDIIHSPKAKEWFESGKHGNKRFSRELFLQSFAEYKNSHS